MIYVLAAVGIVALWGGMGRFAWCLSVVMDGADTGVYVGRKHRDYLTAWWLCHAAWFVVIPVNFAGIFIVARKIERENGD